MQCVFTSQKHIDAVRFRNYLVQHEIDAEIRTSAPESCESAVEESPAESTVWVEDERVTAASVLVDEFLSTLHQSEEEESLFEESSDEEIPADRAPIRARIPILTALFCIACLIASLGWWQDRPRHSDEALMRWGWRDAIDVSEGMYWAVFTSTLPHGSVDHLVSNLIGIVFLGIGIERAYGRIIWLGLFFCGALVSAAAALAARGDMGYGASGVLYAFYGFTLLASARKRLLPAWVLILLSIWLCYGIIFDVADVLQHSLHGKRVDEARSYAHLGGLIAGLLFAFAFVIPWKPRVMRTAAGLVLLAALLPLRGSPWLADWLTARGARAYRDENAAAAIDWYSRALARDPDNESTYTARAEMLFREGRFDEALADCNQAVACDPKSPTARGLRAQTFLYKSELDAALDCANQQMQDGHAVCFAFGVRGDIHLARGEFDAAFRDLTSAIDLEPRTASHWSIRGFGRLERCQFEAALADADHALSINARDPSALLVRGSVFASLAQNERAKTDLEAAHDLLEREMRRRPREIWFPCCLVNCQLALFDLDADPARLVDAFEHAEQAMKIAPDYWEALGCRGAVELKQKKIPRAVADLSRAIELNPHDYWSACNRGLALHGLGRSDDAQRDVDRAIAVNPRFAYGFRSRAALQYARGEFREAIDDLTRAIELNSRFAEAYQLRGKARLALGEVEAAHADLNRAGDLDARFGQPRDPNPSSATETQRIPDR